MTRLFPVILAAFILPAMSALADRDDHDQARRALKQGEVLPLTRILDIAEAETGGRVIEVEFDRDDGRWLYELELLAPGGRLIELEIDAATGKILERDDNERDDEEDDD